MQKAIRMRIEIHLPDDPKFLAKLQALAEKENRSRKNYLETIIIKHVNEAEKPKKA